MFNNPCGLDWVQNQGVSKNSFSLFQVEFASPPQFFGVFPGEPHPSLAEFPLNWGLCCSKGLSQVFYGQGRCAELSDEMGWDVIPVWGSWESTAPAQVWCSKNRMNTLTCELLTAQQALPQLIVGLQKGHDSEIARTAGQVVKKCPLLSWSSESQTAGLQLWCVFCDFIIVPSCDSFSCTMNFCFNTMVKPH